MNKKQLMDLPSIDKYSSRREWEKACWNKIVKSQEILKLIITSHEQHNLVMRAAILKNLLAGIGTRQISRDLSVSFQTIAVGRKALSENNYKSYFERNEKERKKKIYSGGKKIV